MNDKLLKGGEKAKLWIQAQREGSNPMCEFDETEMMTELVSQAQDTKSVKARDKEWVEWLEERKSPAVTAGGYRIFTVDDEEWQALKRGEVEQK